MKNEHDDPYSQRRVGVRAPLILGGTLLLAVIGLGFFTGQGPWGLFSLIGGRAQDSLLVRAKSGQAATHAVSEAQAPAVQAIDLMPAAIREWLNHLEECEKRRRALALRHLSTLMVGSLQGTTENLGDLMAEANSEEYSAPTDDKKAAVATSAGKIYEDWQELTAFFESKPPPVECIAIKDSYTRCLGETGAMVSEVIGALESASSDPQAAVQALTEMMGESQSRIDVAAERTDSLVAEVCKKYEAIKWFSVSGDHGEGLGQLGSLLQGF